MDLRLFKEILSIDSTSGKERELSDFLAERLKAPSVERFDVGDGTQNLLLSWGTPKVVFCGTFMNKARLQVGNGKLTILEEGNRKKFVEHVKQITFSGRFSGENQTVLYITERAVFKLINKKVTLIEIAPGVDLEKDILANMDFRPEIAEDLKLMDPGIFTEEWGGLGKYIEE